MCGLFAWCVSSRLRPTHHTRYDVPPVRLEAQRKHSATDTRRPRDLCWARSSTTAGKRLLSQLPHRRHSSARLPPRPGLSSPLRPGFFLRSLAWTLTRADYRPLCSLNRVALKVPARLRDTGGRARLQAIFRHRRQQRAGTPAARWSGVGRGAYLPVFLRLLCVPSGGRLPPFATSPGEPKNSIIEVARLLLFWPYRHPVVGRTRAWLTAS